jgi:nucleoside-diphosphate-sugar epimerase
LNVLRQAEKAGVKKFVVTSSGVTLSGDPTVKGTAYRDYRTLFPSDFFCNQELNNVHLLIDWNPVTKEDALHTDNKFVVYSASKKYAELAVWEWAQAHPHVDVTTSKPITFVVSLKKILIKQSSPPSFTVHSQTSFFHFRSLNMTPFPLLL